MEELNKKFLAFTAGILLISSARVFVSGAYSSMELLSFYGELFPSFFGVLVFFIAAALIGRINYKIAGILISLYAITGLLTDNTRYIHFLAGITLIIALSLISEFLKEYFPYIVSGFIFDVILRVLALGGEPLDFPATRVLITFLFLITGMLLLKEKENLWHLLLSSMHSLHYLSLA
ncbi:MAG: hypothetical protein H0Z18_01480 [Thermococcus sp.]|uniref:hypothetical protein n=1 Tax=Thermococcus sp. TaxID=35749 RepID=UPI001D23B484|nr:hypothetical protein [Thermococcus sp.]MBO8173909.1 hypothetical protein [Thermococcus sp.]